jgi:hypothetical protein
VRESRSDISREYTGLLSELNLQERFRSSFKQHPLRWVGGAVTAGILTSLFGGKRSKKPAKFLPENLIKSTLPTLSQIGWWGGALEIGKLIYPIFRPFVIQLASSAVQSHLAKRSR